MTNGMYESFDEAETFLAPFTAELTRLLDPADQAAELDQELAETRAALKFDPMALARAEETARQRLEERRREQAGEAAYTLQQMQKVAAERLTDLYATAELAPSPGAAYFRRKHVLPTEEQKVSLDTLHELRVARFDRELATASPSAVLERYQTAIKDPLEPEHASWIAWTEFVHGAGWAGRTLQPHEGSASMQLTAAIKAAKQARRGPGAEKARETLRAVDALVTRATETRIGGRRVEKKITDWQRFVA